MKKLKQLRQEKDIIFKSGFLKSFSPTERKEFLQLCHERTYKKGEYIYYKDDPGTGMYFIAEGEVFLTLNNESGKDSLDAPDGFTLNVADNFGALSISYALTRDYEIRRKSNAICLTDCTLYGFFKPDFKVLKERHPQIAVKFLESLNYIAMQQIEIANNAIENLTDKNYAVKVQFDAYYNQQKK